MYERPSLCREQRIAGTGRSTLGARPDLSAAIPTCCQQDRSFKGTVGGEPSRPKGSGLVAHVKHWRLGGARTSLHLKGRRCHSVPRRAQVAQNGNVACSGVKMKRNIRRANLFMGLY